MRTAQAGKVTQQSRVDSEEPVAAQEARDELHGARLADDIARRHLLDHPLHAAGATEIGIPMQQAGEIVEEPASHALSPACLISTRPASFQVAKFSVLSAAAIFMRAAASAASSLIQAAIA